MSSFTGEIASPRWIRLPPRPPSSLSSSPFERAVPLQPVASARPATTTPSTLNLLTMLESPDFRSAQTVPHAPTSEVGFGAATAGEANPEPVSEGFKSENVASEMGPDSTNRPRPLIMTSRLGGHLG